MDLVTAAKKLGCEPSVSRELVVSAYEGKRQQLLSKLEAAPTQLLKEKFQQSITDVDEAYEVLLASFETVINVDSSGSASVNEIRHSAFDSQPKSKEDDLSSEAWAESQTDSRQQNYSSDGLSETKLADLPGADASGVTGDEEQSVRLEAGQVLAQRYLIKEQIGAGGMGAVYHAFDQSKQENIAVKVLLPALVKNERARSRFMDEARISASLSHPGIVNVFDVQQEDDYLFLTMELLEGQDLRSLMETRKLSRQAFDEDEAKTLLNALCEALTYAHKYTVHRDLKPENIWVTEEGDYKIMDFGIARVMSNSQRTQTGMAMGTAYYMAPEQLKGTAKIDGRADLYALGVLVYELLTGDVPAGRIKPLKDLRKDLSKVFACAIDQALEPKPGERFASAEIFCEALNQSGPRLVIPTLSPKWIAAAVVLLLIGGVVSQGGMGGVWDKIRPLSEAEQLALQSEALQQQGEVNSLLARLQDKRRKLIQLGRDNQSRLERLSGQLRMFKEEEKQRAQAEIDRFTEETDRHQRVLHLLEAEVFEHDSWFTMKGQQAVTESLITQKQYAQALPSFVAVKDLLHHKLQQVEHARAAQDARDQALPLKRQLDELVADKQLDSLKSYQLLAEEFGRIEQAFLEADYKAAAEGYRPYGETLGTSIGVVTALAGRLGQFETLYQQMTSASIGVDIEKDPVLIKAVEEYKVMRKQAFDSDALDALNSMDVLNRKMLLQQSRIATTESLLEGVKLLLADWNDYVKEKKNLPEDYTTKDAQLKRTLQLAREKAQSYEWEASQPLLENAERQLNQLLGGRRFKVFFAVSAAHSDIDSGRERFPVLMAYRKVNSSQFEKFENGSLIPSGLYEFKVWQALAHVETQTLNVNRTIRHGFTLMRDYSKDSQLSDLVDDIKDDLSRCEEDTVYEDEGFGDGSVEKIKGCQRNLEVDACYFSGEAYFWNVSGSCDVFKGDFRRCKPIFESGSKTYEDFEVDFTRPVSIREPKPVERNSDVYSVSAWSSSGSVKLLSDSSYDLTQIQQRLTKMGEICSGEL